MLPFIESGKNHPESCHFLNASTHQGASLTFIIQRFNNFIIFRCSLSTVHIFWLEILESLMIHFSQCLHTVQMGTAPPWLFIITYVSSTQKQLNVDLLEQEQQGFEPRTSGFKTDRSTIFDFSTHTFVKGKGQFYLWWEESLESKKKIESSIIQSLWLDGKLKTVQNKY